MAALPTALQVKARVQSRADRADDIAVLKRKLELPELEYVDTSAQIELQKAVQRWPLLAEMDHLQATAQSPLRQPKLEALT